MAARITLATDPTQEHAPLHIEGVAGYVSSRGGRYNLWTIKRIAEAVNKWCAIYRISPRVVMAQILHETGFFRFDGDVQWWQFNFAGLGATGKVIGHAFTVWVLGARPSWWPNYSPVIASSGAKILWTPHVRDEMIDWELSVDAGVLAVVQHHAVYLYGRKENWPHTAQGYGLIDPRYDAVLKANLADTVMNVEQYGGKWAVPGVGYGAKIVEIANLLPVQETTVATRRRLILPFPLEVAHVPWDNSNRSRQKSLPSGRGWITIHETGNTNIGANAEMHKRFCHGSEGWGGGGHPQGWWKNKYYEEEYEGVLFNYVGDDKKFIELAPRGEKTWQASDGSAGPGNSSVSIELCIHADQNWTQAKENLAHFVVWLIQNDPELSIDRIAQHNKWARDAKNCPTKLRANNNREWNTLMTRIRQIYDSLLEPEKPVIPPRDPNALQVNGFWIINEILHKWESLGENTLPVFGYPLYGMRRYTIDGVERDAQIFERAVLAVYEEGTPDGVPKGHPFRVRALTLQEQDAVIAYAIDQGEIKPFE